MLRQPLTLLPPHQHHPTMPTAGPLLSLSVLAATSTGLELTGVWGMLAGQPRGCHSSLSPSPEALYWLLTTQPAPASRPVMELARHTVRVPASQSFASSTGKSWWPSVHPNKPPSPWWDEGTASSSSHFLAHMVTPGQLSGQRGRGQASCDGRVPSPPCRWRRLHRAVTRALTPYTTKAPFPLPWGCLVSAGHAWLGSHHGTKHGRSGSQG